MWPVLQEDHLLRPGHQEAAFPPATLNSTSEQISEEDTEEASHQITRTIHHRRDKHPGGRPQLTGFWVTIW